MAAMVRLGVTGGIGSGKSYVCRLLSDEFDIPVYNCDIHARIIMLTDSEVIKQLTALIPGIYDDEGELDKQRLAHYLFASAGHAAQVNAIVHPAVRRNLHDWLLSFASEPIVAIESAILYESGFQDEVDRVLFVDASQETRIRRVVARDGLSPEEVLHRMQSQRPDDARRRSDYHVLNDDGSDLRNQLTAVLKLLRSLNKL